MIRAKLLRRSALFQQWKSRNPEKLKRLEAKVEEGVANEWDAGVIAREASIAAMGSISPIVVRILLPIVLELLKEFIESKRGVN